MPREHGRGRGCFWIVLIVVFGLIAGAWLTRTQPLLSARCTAVVAGNDYHLDPDQARNAATIAAIADQRGLPARAASIAIATAIQESKLRNIDYGDRDSLGLFQQRPSQGWGTPEQIMDPIYSTNAFYDVLVKIDGYESMVITEVAQRVQRSAFPDAYGFHEPEARAFASALTGHSPGQLTCRLPELSAQDGTAATRAEAVGTALRTEFGQVRVNTGNGQTVTVVQSSGRLAWATASWAVASADDLGIVSVEVDGQRWQRGRDAEWQPEDSAPDAESGTVRIQVG